MSLKYIKNFISDDLRNVIISNFTYLSDLNLHYISLQAPLSKSFVGDPVSDMILLSKTEEVSKIIGDELLPVYAYGRIYGKNDELLIHKDAEFCEISITCTVDFPSYIEPIYIANKSYLEYDPYISKKDDCHTKYNIDRGDALIYSGSIHYHWREPFKQDSYIQLFLFYVRKNGKYNHHYMKNRPNFGFPLLNSENFKK
ncbi:MAG: hypothetical protein EBU90_24585 [Proteobacteria bacterium]|nr:hypothetical protein [Pseudomonadota bacterium]